MKEKRVDVNLAKAGFYQVIFYGFGGTLLTELMKYKDARPDILMCSGVLTVGLVLVVSHFYRKASRLSKRKK